MNNRKDEMKWELEAANQALEQGDTRLAKRYIEKALEKVRCMICHGDSPPLVPYYKGVVHASCQKHYGGRLDYLDKTTGRK